MKKARFRALKDLWYMIGLWMLMRLNKKGAGKLLIKWGTVLIREDNRKLTT